MGRVLMFWCVVLTCSAVGQGQSPAYSNWHEVARGSDAIVIAQVEAVAWVIDPSKQRGAKAGSTLTDLPDPAEYVLGRVIRLRVGEVLKNHGKMKRGESVSIFLPGRVAREGDALLLEKQNYLLFLGRMHAKGDKFAGAVVIQPDSRTNAQKPFTPGLQYVVIRGRAGALEVNQKNQNLIREVRTAIRH